VTLLWIADFAFQLGAYRRPRQGWATGIILHLVFFVWFSGAFKSRYEVDGEGGAVMPCRASSIADLIILLRVPAFVFYQQSIVPSPKISLFGMG